MLSPADIETLNQLKAIAHKWRFQAGHLLDLVQQCEDNQTTEGIGDMVAFTFNAQQFTPRYGGGGEQLPPGKHKVVIVDSAPQNVLDGAGNVKGGYLALTMTPIEGPLAGQKHIDRLNLQHTNPKTVEIANEQLSAYCHVVGVYNISDTQQLCNIPFVVEIGWQKNNEPSQDKPNGGYTEVKAIFDANGNAPGKAGAGPQAQPPQQPPMQPPAGVAPGAQPPAAGQWGGQPPAGQQQPPAQPPAAGWGQQPPAQPPATGPWGGQPG